MKNNNIICIVVSVVIIFLVGYFTENVTYDVLRQQAFSIRTAATFSDLSLIEKKDYDELRFRKSIYVFGSIVEANKLKDLESAKDWCPYLDEDNYKNILDVIETKVHVSSEEKRSFQNGYEKLLKYCKGKEIKYKLHPRG